MYIILYAICLHDCFICHILITHNAHNDNIGKFNEYSINNTNM